jgi:hypothetical protein
MIIFRKGTRVFHKFRQEFGILTEDASDLYSSNVLFDHGQELEVTTALLVKVRDDKHEKTLKETYDL